MPSEHPLLFTGDMVTALLESRKTHTRRVPLERYRNWKVGDRAYAVEGYYISSGFYAANRLLQGRYLADEKKFAVNVTEDEWKLWWNRKYRFRKTPGRFMYKSLARIWLEITGLRVERVKDITPKNCVAEGIKLIYGNRGLSPSSGYRDYSGEVEACGATASFCTLWDSINAKRGVCETCRGHQKVVGWAGSLSNNSLMQTAEDCPDCDGPTGYSWDKNPEVKVIEFKKVQDYPKCQR